MTRASKNVWASNIIMAVVFLGTISCKETPDKNQVEKSTSTVEAGSQEKGNTPYGGLALYTVRDAMGEDPKATLKTIADIGYQNIEAAGYAEGTYYGMKPEDFKAYLKELHLNPISTHQSSVTLENAAIEMADAKAAGFTYFVVPIPPIGLFVGGNATRSMGMTGGVKNLADILNTLGEKANAVGLKLLYHNHDFEFMEDADGRIPIDYLLENCNPDLVNFQMDLYWVTKAGADPLAYFEKYPGRFKLWHVKDMDNEGKFAPVGNGTIDFGSILAEKEKAGMLYYMVEQDNTFTMPPLEAIKISHEALKKIGFN